MTEAGFLKRVWRGQARLWVAFWLVNVLGQLLLWGVILLLAVLLDAGAPGIVTAGMVVALAGFPLAVVLWVYGMVSVWRCAPNVNSTILGRLARVAVLVQLLGPPALVAWTLYQEDASNCQFKVPYDCPK